jgi:plasmid segregation protein ParM
MIIAIDAGKFATKAVSENGKDTLFRTKSTAITKSMDIEAAGNSNKIVFGDQRYIIGDQGESIDYSLEKNTLLHKMAIYTAAYRLGCTGATNAAVGCPTNIYVSKENRKEFKENIQNKPSQLIIDGIEQDISFNRILIMPESSGIVYMHPEKFKGKRVAVIDLGGRNMNFGIYDNMVPQPSSMFTTNQGSMDIESRIKRKLEALYKKALSTRDIEQIMAQGGIMYQGKLEPKSMIALEEIYQEYVEDISKTIKQGFPIDMMDVVVTGGTSILVDGVIPKYIPHVQVVPDTQWTNPKGFLKIAKVKFNG